MIDSFVDKMNMVRKGPHKNIVKKKKNNYNDKTLVKLEGFAIPRGKRVTLCAKCAKISVCYHTKHMYIHTSAGHLYDTKKKYKWKIFGKYRLRQYLVKVYKKVDDN